VRKAYTANAVKKAADEWNLADRIRAASFDTTAFWCLPSVRTASAEVAPILAMPSSYT